jgi:glycosyltransferase 2 family protein
MWRNSTKWLPWAKALITIAILGFIGRQFYRDLSSESGKELWTRSFGFGWLAISGAVYLAGLACSLTFWCSLLQRLKQRPSIVSAARAYYIGQLGKYLPGKAWALFLRVALVRSPRVRAGVALVASFYEVLTTMAGGGLLAAVVFATSGDRAGMDLRSLRYLVRLEEPPDSGVSGGAVLSLSLALATLLGLLVLPPVFNRLVRRVASPFDLGPDAAPPIGWSALLQGLLLTSACWFLFGLSLFFVLRAIGGEPVGWSWRSWWRDAGGVAVAYVSGFVILLVPSGLGIREFLLRLFLIQTLPSRIPMAEEAVRATASLAVLVLRLVWTSADVAIAALLYWLPGPETGLREARPGQIVDKMAT